jgi:hypothetical protein
VIASAGSIETDMAKALGGGEAAPIPGWYASAAVVSCAATAIAMRAAELEISLDHLEVRADSRSDNLGLLGLDDVYTAYRDIVEQDDLDALIFLGDYIYQYASCGYADDRSRTTGQDFEAMTLDEDRRRYALYKTDELLQSAHARVPWIITWDDHEVENDYAGSTSENDDEVAAFRKRRAAAYQAWYEHMPVRLDPPTGPDYDIYRSF